MPVYGHPVSDCPHETRAVLGTLDRAPTASI